MAHNLDGDVGKFSNLEHIDTGRPRTTNLDELIALKEEEVERVERKCEASSQQVANRSAELKDRMEREDIVTVKYLPIKMSPLTSLMAHEEAEKEEEKSSKIKEFSNFVNENLNSVSNLINHLWANFLVRCLRQKD